VIVFAPACTGRVTGVPESVVVPLTRNSASACAVVAVSVTWSTDSSTLAWYSSVSAANSGSSSASAISNDARRASACASAAVWSDANTVTGIAVVSDTSPTLAVAVKTTGWSPASTTGR
jgi:hypothetical protein